MTCTLRRAGLAAGLGAGVATAACGPGTVGPEAGRKTALESITAATLLRHVETLAHDTLRGRATPSPGLDRAADYVRARLAAAGATPAMDGEWEQRFQVFLPEPGTGINIVGRMEGSDAERRDETIVISAHMDHLGTGPPVAGDSVFNGADDNASGVAALLELAEAFGRLRIRPPRSVIFAVFSAEEKGLLGSAFHAQNPAVPLGATVANLNLDMLSRNGPDSIAVITPSLALEALARGVGDRHPELGLSVVPDPWPELGLVRRSDQFSFIRVGVEGMLLTSGLHEDYHQRSDEADRIDPGKLERVTRLAFLIALDLLDPAIWPGGVSTP